MKPRLAVLGSLNMDLVIRSPRIPQPGETIIGGDFQTIPGSKGANQAVAAARQGAEVSLIGRLGVVVLGGSNAVAVRFSNFELPPFWGAAIHPT